MVKVFSDLVESLNKYVLEEQFVANEPGVVVYWVDLEPEKI